MVKVRRLRRSSFVMEEDGRRRMESEGFENGRMGCGDWIVEE